jgi:hypothetical protein
VAASRRVPFVPVRAAPTSTAVASFGPFSALPRSNRAAREGAFFAAALSGTHGWQDT